MSKVVDEEEEFDNTDHSEGESEGESESNSEKDSEGNSEGDFKNNSESDSDSDSDYDNLFKKSETGSKDKEKDKKDKKVKTKKLKKLIETEKIPALKKLIKIALENDISITDVKGTSLSKKQLYDKLKFGYPDLLKPVEREKIKTEYVKKTLNLEEKRKEFEKLKSKGDKLKEKEEKQLAFLLGVFEKMDQQNEIDEKLMLRKNFIKEEKKRYDEIFSLSLLDNDDIFDSAENYPMIALLIIKVKKNYLKKALQKYVHFKNSHHYYSMLILYRVIRSMDSKKQLIEPVTDAEIQAENERLQEIEKSFMTTKDLEKIKDILDSAVPKEDTVKKIELIKELKQVKKQINEWTKKLKTADDDDDDDDEVEVEVEGGNRKKNSIKKIILRLKDKESQLIKQITKFDKDFYTNIERSIQDLESKLQKEPLSKEDEIIFNNNLKEFKQQEKILFSDPFTFTHFSSVDEIEGAYIILNPFIKDHSKFVMAKDEMLQKPQAYKEEEIKNIMNYLSQELTFAQSIYDHLSEIFISMNNVDEKVLKEMFIHLQKEKSKYEETHPSIQRETVKYMAYRLLNKDEVSKKLGKDEECKQLVSSLIKKQQEIHSVSVKISLKLKEKIMSDPVIVTDKDNSQFLIRNALEILKKKLILKDMTKLLKDDKVEKIEKESEKDEEKDKKEIKDQLEEKFVKYLSRQALSSPYDTQEEIDKIDKLIDTYKFVDIGEFKKYKKALKDETKKYAASISGEYKEFYKQFQEIDKSDDKKKKKQQRIDELVEKNKSLIEAQTKNESEYYKNIKAIETDIIDQFDFKYATDQLKLDKKSASFHFSNHTCPEKFFKKSWIKGYTGIFYVEFVDKIDIPDILIDSSDVFEQDSRLIYRGTRYLDMLLCNRVKDKSDEMISLIKFKKNKYRIRIKYQIHKNKQHFFIDDDNALYQQEQKWLKENTENFKEKIQLFRKKTVKDVEKTLSHFLINHLSSYFEKENAVELVNSLILKYNNKKVDELLDHLGRLVIFLEEKYMKNEAHMFNERLKGGYVRDVDVLKFSVTDILQDVYETISIQKDKCAKKIINDIDMEINDILMGKVVSPRKITGKDDIDSEIREMIQGKSEDIDNLFGYTVQDIDEKFPILFKDCKDKYQYNIEKLNEKIEKSVEHYITKTIFDLLTLNKLIKSGSIEPFRYTKTYKSLENLNCYSKGNVVSNIDTIFYIEDDTVYCFSLGKLLSEGTNINEYTKEPFSPEFMLFLEKFSIPVKTEANMDMEKDDIINDLLQCFYDDIKELDKQASDIDSKFKDIFLVETDPIFTKQSLDEKNKDEDEDIEKIEEIKKYIKTKTEKLKFIDKLKHLKDMGFTAKQIFKSGVELKTLIEIGFNLKDLKYDFTIQQLQDVGFTLQEIGVLKLISQGYTVRQLKNLGFKPRQIIEGSNGFITIQQLKDAGFTLQEIVDDGYIKKIKDAGFKAKELIDIRGNPSELLKEAGFNSEDLKKEGFTDEFFNKRRIEARLKTRLKIDEMNKKKSGEKEEKSEEKREEKSEEDKEVEDEEVESEVEDEVVEDEVESEIENEEVEDEEDEEVEDEEDEEDENEEGEEERED
jgi:hypothetical protein